MTTTSKKNSHAADESILPSNLTEFGHAISDMATSVKNKTSDMLADSLEEVKERTAEKPLKALGIALAVGAVVGYLLRR